MTQIPEEVIGIIESSTCSGGVVRLPARQLDRKLYLATNKVLEALGGRWDRKMKGHVFPGDAAERIDEALTTGTYERPDNFDFFSTPLPLAEEVVARANLSSRVDSCARRKHHAQS